MLAYGGGSRFHPVHVANIAELIRLAAAAPGSRVLNAADPEAPTVAEIGAAIDAVLGHEMRDRAAGGRPAAGGRVGETPWTARIPSCTTCRPPNGSWATGP